MHFAERSVCSPTDMHPTRIAPAALNGEARACLDPYKASHRRQASRREGHPPTFKSGGQLQRSAHTRGRLPNLHGTATALPG